MRPVPSARRSTTAAAVSSQVVSIPSTSIASAANGRTLDKNLHARAD
jgi:hypothetical protein